MHPFFSDITIFTPTVLQNRTLNKYRIGEKCIKFTLPVSQIKGDSVRFDFDPCNSKKGILLELNLTHV